MKQVTLRIKDSKFRFFMELVGSFDFVQIQQNEGDSKEEIIANLEGGLKEVQKIRKGTLKGRPANELLDEL